MSCLDFYTRVSPKNMKFYVLPTHLAYTPFHFYILTILLFILYTQYTWFLRVDIYDDICNRNEISWPCYL